MPHRAGRRAVRRRRAAAFTVRHDLRHQHHPRSGSRHRPLHGRRFLSRADPRRGARRPPVVSGDAVRLVQVDDTRRQRRDLRLPDEPGRREAGQPSNDVRFPANIRASLHGWNLLFAGAEAQPGIAGQLARMAARPLPGGDARPLRRVPQPARHARPGRSRSSARRQQRIGPFRRARHHARRASRRAAGMARRCANTSQPASSALAVASDEMLKVVNLSTSRLNAGDLDAMTIYLLGDAPPAPSHAGERGGRCRRCRAAPLSRPLRGMPWPRRRRRAQRRREPARQQQRA